MTFDRTTGIAPTTDALPPGAPGAAPGVATVADLLRAGPLAPSQAALIGFEAARLVETARQRGEAVRIHPSAVAVDVSARVRLLPLAPGAASTSRWIAPEVRDGRPHGARSLVWSLGRLLRAMLADSAGGPFAPEEGGVAGERLQAIALRATSPDPRRRHASIRQLAREIGAVLLDAAPELV